MYEDAGFGRKTMGDVDVLFHEAIYHLFHLVLPNHDFIAHAISRDGLNWQRVENAVFIGHPGSWDDHMLWTMHVSADPRQDGRWRMFYTGISREDGGRIQRIGCATSEDLYRWEKLSDRYLDVSARGGEHVCGALEGRYEPDSPFPLEAAPPHYESTLEDGRSWVSFRDPFYYRNDGVGRLLVSARVNAGPIIRRGCVAVFHEQEDGRFELQAPLHHPGQYDDIEVPNLFGLEGRYYLVGSIREDAKVRYWWADGIDGPWANFFDNVLLPAGNYAARISFDDRGPLVWNFYTAESDRTLKNLMPPPKRIGRRDDGRLTLRSFEAFDNLVTRTQRLSDLLPIRRVVDRADASDDVSDESSALTLSSPAGFEGFLFSAEVYCFRFGARLHLDGLGKCGLLFRIDPATSSGYYLSLDLLKGVAQLRAWGERPDGQQENMFRFETLQAAYWQSCENGPWQITLTGVRNYLEFAIDGHVLLTLSDNTYSDGLLGLYAESACLRVEDVRLEHLEPPTMPTDLLATGDPDQE
jgi:beta-fructofuranosidase